MGMHPFLCSRYIGAAVHRQRLVFTHSIVNTFFVKSAMGRFFRFMQKLRGSIVFFHIRDFQRPALSEVNKTTLCRWKEGREPELRVVHSRDVELMANVVR